MWFFCHSKLSYLHSSELLHRWTMKWKDWKLHTNLILNTTRRISGIINYASSFESRKRTAKLWGTHSMIFPDFLCWHCWMFFLWEAGKICSIISNKPAEHISESFAKDSTIFGNRILCSLFMLKFDWMYSSFAVSRSWNTLLGVYIRT